VAGEALKKAVDKVRNLSRVLEILQSFSLESCRVTYVLPLRYRVILSYLQCFAKEASDTTIAQREGDHRVPIRHIA
jgi:hypothetical protein